VLESFNIVNVNYGSLASLGSVHQFLQNKLKQVVTGCQFVGVLCGLLIYRDTTCQWLRNESFGGALVQVVQRDR
jgi:hypothetical protein